MQFKRDKFRTKLILRVAQQSAHVIRRTRLIKSSQELKRASGILEGCMVMVPNVLANISDLYI